MIIGFDAKRAFHNYSGLGNYSRLIINSLSNLYYDNLYFLYTPKFDPHPLHDFAANNNCLIVSPQRIKSAFPSSFWRSLLMVDEINSQNVDIFHGLSGELPILKLKMPKVVTVHDLIFLRYPEYYTFFDRKLYEKKFKYACKVADKIITVSKQTADDCIRFFETDPKKIEVGYQSCDPIFSIPQKTDDISNKYNLPEKFILNIGTIEARKNILHLVQALPLIDSNVFLVAIGGRTPYTATVEAFIKENNLAHRVRLMHNIPFRDLPAIYAAASVFVYPSVFEGFGIPVLEALAVGTPVATSNISSMPEVGGDAALYFNPYNVEDIADKINILLNDKETVNKLFENRTKQLEKFSLHNIAKTANDIYINLKS